MPAPDRSGTGRYFNGAGHYAEMPGPVLGEEASLEGWFVWLSGRRSLLTDCSNDPGWNLGFSDGGRLAWAVCDHERRTEVSVAGLGDAWHHHVLVRSGARATYHLDGEVIDRAGGIGGAAPVLPWRVMRDGLFDDFVEGWVADVALHEEALTTERIADRWQAGPPGP